MGKWIPCEERLPSEYGSYLVTYAWDDGEPLTDMLEFGKIGFYEADDEWGDIDYDNVIAWMPLPEPWKGAGDEQ